MDSDSTSSQLPLDKEVKSYVSFLLQFKLLCDGASAFTLWRRTWGAKIVKSLAEGRVEKKRGEEELLYLA